jgi:predicted nucleic acid-binding protein
MAASKRKRALEDVLQNLIHRFDRRIISLDTAILRRWGRLVGSLQIKGVNIPVIDSLLSATALENDLTIVTRNESDFTPAKVKILNIWN